MLCKCSLDCRLQYRINILTDWEPEPGVSEVAVESQSSVV